MKKRRILLVMAALCLYGITKAQTVFPAHLIITKPGQKSVMDNREKKDSAKKKLRTVAFEPKQVDTLESKKTPIDDYPLLRLSGSGGASGNPDSTLFKSGKIVAQFLPDEHLNIYTGFNLSVKPDSVKQGEEPSTTVLLFPDGNQYGFVGGAGYTMELTTWSQPDLSEHPQIMQLTWTPNFEYVFQARSFGMIDTSGSSRKTFKAHTWTLGAKFSMNYFARKFNAGLDLTPGLYLLDISKNTHDEFKSVYSLTNTSLDGKLPHTFAGYYLQIALRLNKVSFYYRYAELRSTQGDVNVHGITHGQHFVGVSFTADLGDIQ